MVGFGCDLCDFLSNRLIYVKQHIQKKHSNNMRVKPLEEGMPPIRTYSRQRKDDKPLLHISDENTRDLSVDPFGEELNSSGVLPTLGSTLLQSKLNSTLSAGFDGPTTSSCNETNQMGTQGKSTPISLEKIIRDEIGDLMAGVVEDHDPTLLNGGAVVATHPNTSSHSHDFDDTPVDDLISLDSDSESDPRESDKDFYADDCDDASDEDWNAKRNKKKKSKKKANNVKREVVPSERPKNVMTVEAIQERIANGECDVRPDANNPLIKGKPNPPFVRLLSDF